MKKLNLIKKKISKENRNLSVYYPSKLKAEFFKGVVMQVTGKYTYET